jgi:anionic cell wall polymer biosynthesis LytR-Cps2A-Psr (LCP) family protein
MKKKFLRTFLVSFLAFVLIYSGAIYYWINFKKDGNDEKGGNFLTRLADDQDELTFLLLGIDSKDITKRDKERSDTMMLCKVDKSSGQVSILSIPRDSRVVIRGRKK